MPSSYPMYFPPQPFDLNTAIMCNKLVNTAYDMHQQWEEQQKPNKENFKWTPNGPSLNYSKSIWSNEKIFWLIDWDVSPIAFVAWSDDGTVYFVVRGTSSVPEGLDDADAIKEKYDFVPGYGHVHQGFYNLYRTFRDDAFKSLQEVTNPKCLYITGHSLGSAMATLAVPDIINNTNFKPENLPVSYYNLAGPRAGDPTFALAYNSNKVNTYRIVNSCDIVPQLPPPELSHDDLYEHVGIQVTYTAQYGSITGNHDCKNSYLYALEHPNLPQGPTSVVIPDGSYVETSKDIILDGNILSAQCKDRKGDYQASTLDIGDFPNRVIKNDNGVLKWDENTNS